jgi:hypothetical protein
MRVFPASDPMISPVYALNLFNVSNRDGRTVLILVERKDTSAYVWHLFDKLNDLRPILK